MRAITVPEFGGPEVLRIDSIPVPEPGPGEVLIRVAAVSVGRLLDLVARSGNHPYARFVLPHVLGADHSGTVVALGDGVHSLHVGDHVGVFPLLFPVKDEYVTAGRADVSPNAVLLGTQRTGADAEYVAVPAENATIVPSDIDPAMVSALSLVGAVAMNQFTRVGGVRAGMNVIVQGATSGLGLATAMLARHLGAEVVVSSRHESKRARLRELGFEHVFDAIDEGFAASVRDAFGGHGADVVVDNLGAPLVWQHGMESLRPLGTVVSSGAFLSRTVPVDLLRLYSQGHRIVGVRTGTLESAKMMWGEVAHGYRTVLDRAFTFEEAAEAHTYVETNANVGRVVLTP